MRLGASAPVPLFSLISSLLTRNPSACFWISSLECSGASDPDRYGDRKNRNGDKSVTEHSEDVGKLVIATSKENDGDDNAGGNNFFGELSTLEDVWRVLKLMVPNRGTDGYIQPSANVIADFEYVVLDMMTIGHRNKNYRGNWKEEKGSTKINNYFNSDGESGNSFGNGSDLLGSHFHPHSPPRSCDEIDLRSLKDKYLIGTFVDGDNGRKYCVLATTSIAYPWGTVIIDLDPSSDTKNLSFDCPHPKFDAETGEQGIRLLKGTNARSWVVAGSHRMANNRSLGTCQPQYSHFPSDAAHSVDSCFLAAVAAIKFYYESIVHEDYTSVQLHGMSKTTCGSIDTFFSHGSCSESIPFKAVAATATTRLNGNIGDVYMEKIEILRNIATSHPLDQGHHVFASKSSRTGGCELCGTTNIQGRFINGVTRTDLCGTAASSYNGRFIHLEQKRDYRRESRAEFWNDVFNTAYPLFSTPPAATTAADGNDSTESENCNPPPHDERNAELADFILFSLVLHFLL